MRTSANVEVGFYYGKRLNLGGLKYLSKRDEILWWFPYLLNSFTEAKDSKQDTSIAVNIYKGQITSYSFVPVCIFYAKIIFLVLSGKMLMQYKVQSHTMELDQKACGTSMPNGML